MQQIFYTQTKLLKEETKYKIQSITVWSTV